MQLLQSVESSCTNPLLVIYYIAPFSAIFMTPISLVDIFDKDLKSVQLDANILTKVVILIVLAGVCSFALVFAEVSLTSLKLKGVIVRTTTATGIDEVDTRYACRGLMRTDECGSKLLKLKD